MSYWEKGDLPYSDVKIEHRADDLWDWMRMNYTFTNGASKDILEKILRLITQLEMGLDLTYWERLKSVLSRYNKVKEERDKAKLMYDKLPLRDQIFLYQRTLHFSWAIKDCGAKIKLMEI